MSIAWNYLDKRNAAVEALKDYDNMQYIIDHTDEQIHAARDRMAGISAVKYDGVAHASNPGAGEDRVVNELDEIDVLKERYRQAKEYMEWFQPAWDFLSEDEKYVLETFYTDDKEYGSSMVDMIAAHYNIERSSAYRRKNRAVEKLTVLLFGRP